MTGRPVTLGEIPMSMPDWQLVVALGCTALAVGVLVRRAVGFFRAGSPTGSGGCGGGGCGSCPSAADEARPAPLGRRVPLVSLDDEPLDAPR